MGALKPDHDSPDQRPRLAVVGAGGSIGEQLSRTLASSYRVVAITALATRVKAGDAALDIEWRHCDLFSLADMERVLDGSRFAIFLAHSGLPNSRLQQANCSDMDLLIAENFARAAESLCLEHICCLRSLLPPREVHADIQRRHQQVEEVVAAYATPVTVIRSGLVVEPGSALVRLISNQVRRARFVPVPAWSRHRMQPIATPDLARAFTLCLDHPAEFTGEYDIGGPDILDWQQVLEQAAALAGSRSRFFPVKRLAPSAYIRWLRRVPPRVHPEALELFVQNLRDDAVVADNPLQQALQPGLSPALAGLRADDPDGQVRRMVRFRRSMIASHSEQVQKANTVRSIQRVKLPEERTATWLASHYFNWLMAYMRPVIRCVETPDHSMCIRLTGLGLCLLRLDLQAERSDQDRQIYTIAGGVLASRKLNQRGRMEFRQLSGGKDAIIAIHDFAPALPWNFYLATQAALHRFVMGAFQRHVQSYGR